MSQQREARAPESFDATSAIRDIAIVGVGLIGGSFGLALRDAGFDGDLIGVSSAEALAAGLKVGAVTRSASLHEAAASADLIYLAQPVDRILSTIEQLAPSIRPAALVTDAGSTKVAIVKKAGECLSSGQFLGGHPMAGKEQRGAEAADAQLFRNRPYILTPTTSASALASDLRSWLRRIGSDVQDMSPELHDETVALTSHLPQLISSALALTLARQDNQYISRVFGQGLLDMTRLSASSPELWRSILSTNRTKIVAALAHFEVSVKELKDSIDSGEFTSLFNDGANFTERLRQNASPMYAKIN